MRIIALLAAYNEERFIAACLEHLFRHGIHAYLIDNCSTDATVSIAEHYLRRGLIGIETLERKGTSDLALRLRTKERLTAELDADWFMHMDVDEFRLPPRGYNTLADAIQAVDVEGYNAVNFLELTFIPTRETPDHDHSQFLETMRWYYPFLPCFPHRLNAWKRQPVPVDLVTNGGHRVSFPGLIMYPGSFWMRHYQFLSEEHAYRKYARIDFDPSALARGWHGWRAEITHEKIALPSETELRRYTSDDKLSSTHPRKQHYLADCVLHDKLSSHRI